MSADRPEIDPEGKGSEDLLERLIREAEQGTVPVAKGEVLPAPSSAPSPTGGVLGGLLSNPAIWSALPQILNGLGHLSDLRGNSSGESTTPESKTAAAQGTTPEERRNAFSTPDRHTALLCALKPYLGHERQQVADYLISLCRMWGTLQSVGISLPALLLPTQNEPSAQDVKEV